MSFGLRRTKRDMLLALGAIWLMFEAPGIWGQNSSDVSPLPAEIRILADANPKTATVGDPVEINLDIFMPQGYRAEIAKPVPQSADISITDFFPGPSLPETNMSRESTGAASARAGALTHHRARIVVAIYRTGKFSFPPIPVKIKTAEGKEIAASTAAVEIQIQSVLAEKNPALKDLKKQADIPEPSRWLLWGGIAVAAALLCGIAWYFWRRRRRKPVSLTPAQKQDLLELAQTDLRNLLAQGFPEKGQEKQFYILLSDIAKRILNAGYGIHTAEQTTSEIMDALNRNTVPDSEEINRIESFLLRCDVVKFAKYVPSGDEHASAADDALRILTAAKEAVVNR